MLRPLRPDPLLAPVLAAAHANVQNNRHCSTSRSRRRDVNRAARLGQMLPKFPKSPTPEGAVVWAALLEAGGHWKKRGSALGLVLVVGLFQKKLLESLALDLGLPPSAVKRNGKSANAGW